MIMPSSYVFLIREDYLVWLVALDVYYVVEFEWSWANAPLNSQTLF